MAVKVGILGTGGIAGAHMQRLSKIEDAQMVAFCDIVEEKAKAAVKNYGGKAYTDYKKMLDQEELDALYVCLPPDAHGDPEVAAAERGIHMLVEKPVTNCLETAREIEAAIKEAGIISSVAYHWRYLDTTARAKQMLEGKSVGMALGYWMGGLPGISWWRMKERSGGQFVEQTTHIFDLARYLVGDVKRVYGATALRTMADVPELDIPDVGTCVLEFENGAIGTISNSCMLSQGYRVGLVVTARDLVVEAMAGELRIIEPGQTLTLRAKLDAFLEEGKTFLNAVKTGDRSAIKSDYSDGLKSLAVSLAAVESAEKHQPVEL